MYLLTKTNYFSFLLALMPLSFIAGNMIININVLILIFSSLIFFYSRLLKMKFYLIDKLFL